MDNIQSIVSSQISQEQNDERRTHLQVILQAVQNLEFFDFQDKYQQLAQIFEQNKKTLRFFDEFFNAQNTQNQLIPIFNSYENEKYSPGIYIFKFNSNLNFHSTIAFDGSNDQKGPFSTDSNAIFAFDEEFFYKIEIVRNHWKGGDFGSNADQILLADLDIQSANEQFQDFKKGMKNVNQIRFLDDFQQHQIVYFGEYIQDLLGIHVLDGTLHGCYKAIQAAQSVYNANKDIKFRQNSVEYTQLLILEEIRNLRIGK
ncbi:hypothetical protein SS50377_27947 [Spironucleus salmonicida]|uniref:Uncharacterized protein n=1 Tax=Spironucleus salmonicida TaxID=348837 RepID=V6LP55_9EUKA|nr:hypothetical protein SS50377_27947 [Spironucleus salmonicida]|eukprot:EST42509.1 Hypothetical protein SS50377_17815 [Spironucleus salmonicida]